MVHSGSKPLGVRDNNDASWTQVLDVLEFMSVATDLPILLDGDTGYGNFNNARRLVRKLEQRNIAGVVPRAPRHSFDQALTEFFAEGGVEARHRRYVAWETLDSDMRGLGFRRLLPEAILSRILTAYIEPDHPSYSFDAMHNRLYAAGFTIYPGKGAQKDTFRLANMGQ